MIVRSILSAMNLNELKQQLKAHANPVIVDIWAPWCVPCRFGKPILESLAKEYEGRVNFWAINADEHSELLRELKISGIPTLLVTRRGEIIKTHTGSLSRENYRQFFEALAGAQEPVAISMPAFDRFLRLGAGLLLGLVGLATSAWLLIPIGAVIGFLGLYDRCPLWRAITTYLSKRTP